ncbi:TPA: hypothetical protein N0F65_002192 [Lagenidium giganteum]|uniref:Peptidase C1A papain C-terminal domain-containing protein n=1 Tax=Lagenidium giganteum TaxID=4803 RepID=A0AAV2YKU1_9STRA|nr:TPA: hypothetical protein N0F65_002192 [Lagenidium giganteum]
MHAKSDLPLLNKGRSGRVLTESDDEDSMLSNAKRSFRQDRFRIRTIGSIIAWVAVGGAINSIVHGSASPQPAAHVDLTHAVRQETDLLASCSSAGLHNNTEPKLKNTHWFLGGPDPELRLEEVPAIKSIDELPEHWDWRDYNGTGISLTTSVMNQMVPKPCGSCWAFATVSALSDRIRIANYRKYGKLDTEVIISPQVLLDCGMRSFGSCSGGDPRYAHKWIHENGIVDTTCNPYIASHPSWFAIGEDCAATQCRTCRLNGECSVLENPKKYYVSSYGTLNATNPREFELEAMNEIYHRGPIVVSMYSHSKEYINYKGGYVLRDATKYPGTTHVVSLVGWGKDENGINYWIVRNSDGTNWGDNGFFLVERGVNIYNMEGHGAWSVPVV